MRAKVLFALGLLVTLLLLLPACTEPPELTPIDSTPILAFNIDPQRLIVTQAEPDLATVSTTSTGQHLVNDLLNLDSMNYHFSGNKLILEAVFTNISSTSLGQVFSFIPNPATSNIVSSVEPTVSDADLGGDGVLSPGEATATLRFEVTHRYQPFSYVVDAYAVITPLVVTPDLATLQLNGDAAEVAGILRLTPNLQLKTGSAFYGTALVLTDHTSVATRFQFRIHGGWGDGLTFMFQSQGLDAIGPAGSFDCGSCLGYGQGKGGAGISPSLAVEIDTVGGWGSDPNANHLGLVSNGNTKVHLVTFTPPFDLDDGNSHVLWVDYHGLTDTLEVFLAQSVTSPKPAAPVISVPGIDLPGTVGASSYVGFSAATGGLANNHDIEDWSFTVSSY